MPCSRIAALDPDGKVGYHDFPEPCRSLCPGSKRPSVETLADAPVTD